MTTKLFLAAGACFSQEGIFDKCALQPSDCSAESTVFRSSHWLNLNDISISNKCSDEQTIRTLNSLGRCNGQADRYICTSHKTACRFAAVFEPNTDDCNLLHDFYENNEFSNTHYGFCYNSGGEEEENAFCTWSFQECGGSGSEFLWHGADTFFADSKPPCHCDDVRVGACVDGSNTSPYCAVSGDVCDTDLGFTYLKVLDLESQLSIECNVCSPLSDEDLKLPNDLLNSSKDKGNNNGQTVGIVVGIILSIVGIISLGLVVRSRTKRTNETSSAKEEIKGDDGKDPDGNSPDLNSVL